MEQKQRRQLGKSVIWNTLGNVIYLAAQYVLQILITQMSGNYAAGLLSTAMAVTNVTLSVANYGMRSFQISDLDGRYTDRTYLRSRWITVAAAGVGTAAFAFCVSYSAEQRLAILLYTLIRLSEGYIDVWHGYLQRANRMDLVGRLFGLRGIVTMAGFGAGVALTGSLNAGLALVAALNWLCVFAADLPPARKEADFARSGGGTVWLLLWECVPLAVYSFLNSSIGSVVKLFCERVCGTEAFGGFNNVFAPVQLVQVGAMYVFAPFMMTFARAWADRNRAVFYRGLALVCAAAPALWVCGAVGAGLLGPFFLEKLYGAGILAYAGLLQPAVIAAVANLLVSVFCYLLAMMRGMKGLIAGNLAGIAAALAVSQPMLEAWGTAGAAWATVAARAVQGAVCFGVLLWQCRRHFAAGAAGAERPEAEK